jgi:hypothetical protein
MEFLGGQGRLDSWKVAVASFVDAANIAWSRITIRGTLPRHQRVSLPPQFRAHRAPARGRGENARMFSA